MSTAWPLDLVPHLSIQVNGYLQLSLEPRWRPDGLAIEVIDPKGLGD
jgi:hypothetical protein